MEKFKILTSIPAPLNMSNVDTDMIIPKQFLKTIKRSGLGKSLFYELRYDLNGNIKNDFVLNWDPYNSSKILIAGENFGCGSSREHAPWSLLDFGFRCIIANSFADIFYNNCFKNGILPIVLEQNFINELTKDAVDKKYVKVDLENQILTKENGKKISFTIDPYRKKCLLEGLDDIDLTLKKSSYIDEYEKKIKKVHSWII